LVHPNCIRGSAGEPPPTRVFGGLDTASLEETLVVAEPGQVHECLETRYCRLPLILHFEDLPVDFRSGRLPSSFGR